MSGHHPFGELTKDFTLERCERIQLTKDQLLANTGQRQHFAHRGTGFMARQTRNVFISHIHENDDGLTKLKDLLKASGMTARDYSVKADNPNNAHSEDYIKYQVLAPRIQQSSTLVVYVSRETRESPWVDWEIEYAEKQGKRVVGVWAHGEAGCEVPDALDQYADAVVGWKGNRIVGAINGEINGWEYPDGTNRVARDIHRFNCK